MGRGSGGGVEFLRAFGLPPQSPHINGEARSAEIQLGLLTMEVTIIGQPKRGRATLAPPLHCNGCFTIEMVKGVGGWG